MKFPYFKLPLQRRLEYIGASILKPIIPISILANDKELRYAALIDSGADFCIFDAEIGDNLGINISSGLKIEFGGIQEGKVALGFLHHVAIKICGVNYRTMVGFSHDISKHGYGVLGQKGFFDIFVVKFDLIREEIELKSRLKIMYKSS